MAIERTQDGAVIITGNDIDTYRLLALKGALKLETLGMKRRGPSAYSIVKKEFNLRGDKVSVLKQFEALIAEATK
jgi:hypothetical protein